MNPAVATRTAWVLSLCAREPQNQTATNFTFGVLDHARMYWCLIIDLSPYINHQFIIVDIFLNQMPLLLFFFRNKCSQFAYFCHFKISILHCNHLIRKKTCNLVVILINFCLFFFCNFCCNRGVWAISENITIVLAFSFFLCHKSSLDYLVNINN
jgi:hypothetical protein